MRVRVGVGSQGCGHFAGGEMVGFLTRYNRKGRWFRRVKDSFSVHIMCWKWKTVSVVKAEEGEKVN